MAVQRLRIRSKKIKNIVIPEIPTVEDVIIEVIQHYKPMLKRIKI
jgi:uroporphyrinogen-III synthase